MNTIAGYAGMIDKSFQDTVMYSGLYQARLDRVRSPGIVSLESVLLGSTSVSMEGIVDKIKGVIAKVKGWMAKSYEKTIVKMNELISKFKKFDAQQTKELKDIQAGRKKLTDETALPLSPKAVRVALKVAASIAGAAALGVMGKRYIDKSKAGTAAVVAQYKQDRQQLDQAYQNAQVELIGQRGNMTNVKHEFYWTKKGRMSAMREAVRSLEQSREKVERAKSDIENLDAEVRSKSLFGKFSTAINAVCGFVAKSWGKLVSIYRWVYEKLSAKGKKKTEE